MKLFILRHGKAGEGIPDSMRELTERGREDVRQITESRKAELSTIQRILSSSLVRAEQTAAIAADVLGFSDDIVENIYLTPWAKPLDFLKSIKETEGDTLIASHQPFVSDLVSCLTEKDIWMPTSSLVCVEAEYLMPGSASLIWQSSP